MTHGSVWEGVEWGFSDASSSDDDHRVDVLPDVPPPVPPPPGPLPPPPPPVLPESATPAAPPPTPPPPPTPEPAEPAASGRRSNVGVPWGCGNWTLAEIKKNGVICAFGAHCKDHHTPGSSRVCKKHVSIGGSGLDLATLRLRMKRWLVAGLDSDEWETDDQRAYHIAMGDYYLEDFADGLTEPELDAIANAG